MNIVLGTAQFGQAYGVSNCVGEISIDEVEKILIYCSDNGIKEIDTAFNYGNSLNVLNEFDLSDFSVTSKIPKIGNAKNPQNKIDEYIYKSLLLFDKNKIENMLFHDEEDLYKYENYQYMCIAKNKYDFKNVGVSVYNVRENLLNNEDIEMIQMPGSIIDRRFCELNSEKLYIRSIFLQGLLLMKNRPSYFNTWNKLFNEIDDYILSFDSRLAAMINFINMQNPNLNVVVGVTKVGELEEIVKFKDFINDVNIPDVSSKDMDLINPGKWEL